MELKQLFNAMDASPFRERDLDPGAEDLIVGWAAKRREAQRSPCKWLWTGLRASLRKRRHCATLCMNFSGTRAGHEATFASAAADWPRQPDGRPGVSRPRGHSGRCNRQRDARRSLRELLRQGLVICGWVAMWRPLEILLYGWWPIRTEARLYDRLSEMPVRIEYGGTAEPDAWRRDWPAMPPAPMIPQKSPPPVTSHRGTDDASDAPVAVPERGPIAAASIDAGIPDRGSKGLTPKP